MCVGGKPGPSTGASELAQSGSRVRFMGEDDKRVMKATVAVSQQEPSMHLRSVDFPR